MIEKVRVYIEPEGKGVDFNSPYVELLVNKTSITLPAEFPNFPNPKGLSFLPFILSWTVVQPVVEKYVARLTSISGTEESDMGDPVPVDMQVPGQILVP